MSIPYKKLKNLPEAQNLQDSDITIIEDLDTTRKGTLRQLVQYLKWHNDINTYTDKAALCEHSSGLWVDS